ncbi:MAG: hypothetical protein HUK40_23460 [Desulfobacter sp.]|nr:hypothetical protein [Desulfobacter sp.]WDP85960.1 MAG: hypothetical protein HUN05_13130 [Desulfobacter sp.]
MTILRSGIDRRSNINRRHMALSPKSERRSAERREQGERREKWVRCSQWRSIDLDQMNQYFWHCLN